MTFYIDQQILIFLVLMFGAVMFFGGWVTKISIDQYKADRKREQEAEMRRMAYMCQQAKQRKLDEQHKLWDSNMKETADVFEEKTKGGAKK